MNLFQVEAYNLYTEQPEQSVFRPHTHDACELYCFLGGSAVYSVEGNIYPLFPGDIIVLRNAEMHHLILRKSIPYTRISITFRPDNGLSEADEAALLAPFLDRPIGLYNRYPASRFPNRRWDYYLELLCRNQDSLCRQIYLMTVLRELADCFPQVREGPVELLTDSMIKITHYIDAHLGEPLDLDRLSQRFYISKAQLTRSFKKNLGTTVGDYIITKRLLLAHRLIQNGQAPTSTYLQCGFRDYSAFFKAFKKKFGYAPKNTNQKENR